MRMCSGFRGIFAYMANQGLTWPAAIAELVDNAFDQAATCVKIKFGTDSDGPFWEVSDDGKGCDDITRMLPIGSHYDQGQSNQPVGMWGVGLKDAWAFTGDQISIETCKAGRCGALKMHVDDVSDIDGPDPSYRTIDQAESGTRVKIWFRQSRRAPKAETWDRVAWIFTPALTDGKQISVEWQGKKKNTLKRVELPQFLDSVQDTFEVAGRSVKISIGIVKDGERMKGGPFWISYGHRNIRETAIGAVSPEGRCYSTLRMGGTIALGKGWTLTKNKDDLSGLSEDLGNDVFIRIEHLLKKHEHLSQDVESSALKNQLASMLNESINAARKEKRNPPENNTGAVLPKHTGRKRLRFAKDQPAGDSGERKKRGFSIDWMDSDSATVGVFDDLSSVVRLNISHPFIEDVKADGNLPALYAIAVHVVSDAMAHADRKQRVSRLMFESTSLVETYAKILRTVKGKQEAKANVA